MVVHILSLGLMGGIAYLARPGTDLFSWHPTLMAAGFGLLMVQVGEIQYWENNAHLEPFYRSKKEGGGKYVTAEKKKFQSSILNMSWTDLRT